MKNRQQIYTQMIIVILRKTKIFRMSMRNKRKGKRESENENFIINFALIRNFKRNFSIFILFFAARIFLNIARKSRD